MREADEAAATVINAALADAGFEGTKVEMTSCPCGCGKPVPQFVSLGSCRSDRFEACADVVRRSFREWHDRVVN